jgi:predicted Zn finger-like uncharacterized protein
MIVSCQQCNTKFNLKEELVTLSGTKVRCSKCKYVFMVYPLETDQGDLQPATPEFERAPAAFDETPRAPERMKTDFQQDYRLRNTTDTEEAYKDEDFDLSIIDDFFKEDKKEPRETALQDDAFTSLPADEKAGADDEFDLSGLDDFFREEENLEVPEGGIPAETAKVGTARAEQLSAEEDAEDLDLSGLDDFFKEGPVGKEISVDADMGEAESEYPDIEEAKDLDLSDLESLLDVEATEKDQDKSESLDLDLEFETGPEDESKVDDIEDDFDISDLDFDLEPEAAKKRGPSKEAEKAFTFDDEEIESEEGSDDVEGLDLDLSDLELDLDLEAGGGKPAPGAEGEDEDFELDLEPAEKVELGGLELDIDAESETEAETGEAFDLSDLELDLESPEEKPSEAAEIAGDELELSDLEFEDITEETARDEETEVADLELDLEDADLDMDLGKQDAEATVELEIEAEEGDTVSGFAEPAEMLDLSQLELEFDKAETGHKARKDEDLEFDLDLDMEGAGKESEKLETGAAPVKELELDLSDIEDALDIEAVEENLGKPGEKDETLNIDLDFDLDAETKTAAAKSPEMAEELQFDDIGENVSAETAQLGAAAAAAAAAVSPKDEEQAAEAPSYEQEYDYEEEEETDKAFQDVNLQDLDDKPFTSVDRGFEERAAMQRPRKGVGKPVLVFILLILLLGGAAGALYYVHHMGVKIPVISDYLNQYLAPGTPDAGNIKIKPSPDPASEFIDNAKAGRLFVISGQVKNEYNHPRSLIMIKGTIFTTGKKPFKNETVYCGNIIDSVKLASMDLQGIAARLMNRFGDNQSNVKVPPGKTIPYMIVFSNVPPDLDEFAVEVVSSSPG